jgi:hypothetical protein
MSLKTVRLGSSKNGIGLTVKYKYLKSFYSNTKSEMSTVEDYIMDS